MSVGYFERVSDEIYIEGKHGHVFLPTPYIADLIRFCVRENLIDPHELEEIAQAALRGEATDG